ncbi:hypothetical protein PISL3812_04998 [Talaromyces islandicus]|uniref:60S ribosomal protein L36 n=1 Tax=Talaromyces islandicus TaxID=28573 RepID=A0A0U1LYR0_TALIS|nr:hypothetical protein PISL3812_04998 [Talaromyces islandicus]
MAKERSGIIVGLNKGHPGKFHYEVEHLENLNDGTTDAANWILTFYAHHNGPRPRKYIYNPTELKKRLTFFSSSQKTTPVETKARISRSKGRLSRRTAFVREIVKEVAGLAPYERRVVELLRNSQDKRARKLAKKRLGTIGRAKAKVDEMQKVIAEARRAGH